MGSYGFKGVVKNVENEMMVIDVVKIVQYLIKNYLSLLNIIKLILIMIDGIIVIIINKMFFG